LPPQNHCFLDWQNPPAKPNHHAGFPLFDFEDVLLSSRLMDAIARINPTIPDDAQQEAIKEISRIHSPELLTNNETFHRMLTEGVKVSYQNTRSPVFPVVRYRNSLWRFR
jgi:type I site-specific restriction-modification system R (restriction) subunit